VTGGPRRPGRPARLVRVAALLALLLAGCNGTPSPPASLAPILAGPTPTVTSYSIGTTGWIDGFIVTVNAATASLDAKGGTLSVNATLQNAGTDDAVLDVPIVVTAGDTTFQLTHGTGLPEIAGDGVVNVTLPFDIVGRGTVDDAVIRIGRDGDHAIAIPLRSATAGAVRLEPIELTITGNGQAGSLRAVLHHVQLRWDLPDWHDELPLATRALTITYDVTYAGTFSGGTAFTGANVQLQLPDGTRVSPRADGHSQSIVLIGPGKTAKGLTSRFEIPDGVNGKFALVVIDGSASKPIAFTLGP